MALLRKGYMCLGAGIIHGTTWEIVKGHKIWYLECKEPVQFRVTFNGRQGIRENYKTRSLMICTH
jgi:hypothetical protein